MEVIVDDTQLSLAIGKKGQNVRLAARLLGWRIDIKSEEEKRQEVETEMAALVVPGAPISVLIEHGLGEKLMEKLAEASVNTVEQLGQMTPEQLEEIPGIGPKMVERIQSAVVSYYGQFEAALSDAEEAPSADGTVAEADVAQDYADPGIGIPEIADSAVENPTEAGDIAEDAAEDAEEKGSDTIDSSSELPREE